MPGSLRVDNLHELHDVYRQFFAWQYISRVSTRIWSSRWNGGSFHCHLHVLKHCMWGSTVLSWQLTKCCKKARQGRAMPGTQVSQRLIYLIKIASLEPRPFSCRELLQDFWHLRKSSCSSVQGVVAITLKLFGKDLEAVLEGPRVQGRKAQIPDFAQKLITFGISAVQTAMTNSKQWSI